MNNLSDHPAIIYHLGPLLSLLGRSDSNCDDPTLVLQNEIYQWLAFLNKDILSDKPLVPKNDLHSVNHFKQIIGTIQKQVSTSKVSSSLKNDIKAVLRSLLMLCEKNKTDDRLKVAPDVIAHSLGIPRLWDLGEQYAKTELKQFRSFNKHPKLNNFFQQRISIKEVHEWIEIIKQSVLRSSISLQKIKIYKTKKFANKYLMWMITDCGLEYCLPNFLTKADFFSWDCPHNIAHLLHLSSVPNQSTSAYYDTMLQRGLFEAVAVYAEHLMWEYLISSLPLPVNRQQRVWLIQDRGHEFLLRLIRLLADQLSLEGYQFTQIVTRLHQATGISKHTIRIEVNRYYGLLGLGSVYTVGYLKHKRSGKSFDEIVHQANEILYPL